MSFFVNIASFLNLKDLFSFSQVSKQFYSVFNLEIIWSNLLIYSNFIADTILEKKPINSSSHKYFKYIYSLYKEIKRNLFEISQKLSYEQYFFQNKNNFLIPNEKALGFLNQKIKNSYGTIPISYFLLYYIMNGQESLKCLENYRQSPKAFFGGFSYYYEYYEYFFLPIEFSAGPTLKNFKFHTLAKESRNFYLLIDFDNVLGFGSEAIFSIISQENSPNANGVSCTVFLINTSLVDYLRKINSFSFDSNAEKQYIDHLDTLKAPDSDTITKGIRIRAKALFNPWDQRIRDRLFFPYQIRISDAGVDKKYKFLSRKWLIKDGDSVEIVQGDGVIGKFPEIYEGCEDFVYESVSPIRSLRGGMQGSFFFRACDGSKEILEARIDEFKFEIGEGRRLLTANFDKREVYVII